MDECILDKFKNLGDKPKSSEIDVWYKNEYFKMNINVMIASFLEV